MKHAKDILFQSATIIEQRGTEYGPALENFEKACYIATAILEKPISVYDLCIIMTALKLSRISANKRHEDSFVDAASYLAFAAQFSNPEPTEKMPAVTQFNFEAVKMKMADALSEQK
jgi:hypothetical protein